jgi:hypothetical protein
VLFLWTFGAAGSCTILQQDLLSVAEKCLNFTLQVKLGERIDVPVFELGTDAKPDEIAAQGVAKARKVSSLADACIDSTLWTSPAHG